MEIQTLVLLVLVRQQAVLVKIHPRRISVIKVLMEELEYLGK
jgi:hypothetical protein